MKQEEFQATVKQVRTFPIKFPPDLVNDSSCKSEKVMINRTIEWKPKIVKHMSRSESEELILKSLWNSENMSWNPRG